MQKATSVKQQFSTTDKTVQVIARYEIKRSRLHRALVGHVAYLVRSSKSNETYCTTLVNGKATGCTCPSKKPCYHMRDLVKIEAARETKAIVPQLSSVCASVSTDRQCPQDAPVLPEDEEFTEGVAQRWMTEELSIPMDRSAYVAMFDPCYIG